ncbi:helix-turn-helix domain-containing protein [Streptomyces chartreusis]|uniref:Helix-turn-helix transcriptional regulator n=1 Tax=Streptomyces chartreusis TaxID=1969 RepID=A0A7H8TH73_STRCX|nr:helix-turn-helix transcriptional regulator [Streptomyces chartreusis]QKZ22863.1 helix-turn-helix transcriptional regulator [Streptomyces chartreusis]
MREALASWHMGQVFYAYRSHPWHGRVLSQEAMAAWLDLNQAQLSRIESGKPPQDLGKLMRWAHSLKIPADLLWFKLPARKDEASTEATPATAQSAAMTLEVSQAGGLLPVVVNGRTVLVPVDAETIATSGLGSLFGQLVEESAARATEREPMSPLNRRDLLKGGIAAVALPGLGLDELHHVAAALDDAHCYLDGPVVDYFRHVLDKAKRDDGALGPKKTLPVMLGLLGAIEAQARDVKPGVRRELLALGADGAEFAGWLYRDIQQPQAAVFWYDRAMEWAQEADNAAMQGYVLLKKSQMAYDERDALRMLTLAQAAGSDRWQLPARVRAEVTQQEALGRAMLGDPLDVVRGQLADAETLLTNAPEDQPDALGAYFTGHTRLLRDAITYTEAGKPSLAADLFSDVMSTGTLSHRDTGFFNARRAAALALSGEPDEAARVGKASAAVAHEVRSERTVRVLGEVLQTLDRWRSRPAVREFRESLTA